LPLYAAFAIDDIEPPLYYDITPPLQPLLSRRRPLISRQLTLHLPLAADG